MADTAPVAPNPAPAESSVANQTNSNPAEQAPAPQAQAQAPAEQQITAEQVAKFFGTTPEAINKSKTFVENNGGYDKVFANRKQEITDPDVKKATEQAQAQPTEQAPAQPQQAQAPAPEAKKVPEGMLTPQELAVQQYFNGLAAKKEYANIADEIRSGDVFKEMEKLGIKPTIDGNVNAAQVNTFLEMYSKTKPANTPTTPVDGTAPTKTYTEVPEGKFTSMEQARGVAMQKDHPQYKAALDYIYGQLSGKQQQPEGTSQTK